jgi:site-specific recombinase XerD
LPECAPFLASPDFRLRIFGRLSPAVSDRCAAHFGLRRLWLKQVKRSTYIQAVSAPRFICRNTLRHRIDFDRIPLPRYEQKLPVVLTEEQVGRLLEAPKRLCDRGILATLYGAGLRASEAIGLEVADPPVSVRSCTA